MNKPTLIIINGHAGSGKDTFVNMCTTHSESVVLNIHRSDLPKALLEMLGWNGEKTPKVRKLLKDMVDFAETNGFYDKAIPEMLDKCNSTDIMFYHMRDTDRYESIIKACSDHAGIITTVLIDRDNPYPEEPSEWCNTNYPYDFVIQNDSDLEALQVKAQNYMRTIESLHNNTYGGEKDGNK